MLATSIAINGPFHKTDVSASFNGYVNSITDTTGVLGSTVEVGSLVSSSFTSAAQLFECGSGGFSSGAICYFGGTSSAIPSSGSLTIGDADFNNVFYGLSEILQGSFAGDSFDSMVISGVGASSNLGAVRLGLTVKTGGWLDWHVGSDFSTAISETPYISCSDFGCVYQLEFESWTSLIVTGEQYEIEIYLTDFKVDMLDIPIPVVPVPVPAAIWLFGSGLALLGAFKRRR